MPLIKSISGIRGTIGGEPGSNLTPLDIVQFSAAYAYLLNEKNSSSNVSVVIGRDARPSGPMVQQLVASTLNACGIHVIDLGLSTTPTVEMAVVKLKADGGIILTASHNPVEWNALKLLNEKGEFISGSEGEKLLQLIEENQFNFSEVQELGTCTTNNSTLEYHIDQILKLPLVDKELIAKQNFKIVVDAVNSSGGIAVPEMLRKLGVKDIVELNCNPDGNFSHNPEPLPEHLTEIFDMVKNENADLGFVVDPDVDRLAMVCEDGSFFGEEYTLVAVADYVLQNKKGATVSNLSSSRALRDVSEKAGGHYHASAVGEVNVVVKMKEVNAVIGGEGNGGIIYPELHYGRDALAGIALLLTHLAKTGMKMTELKSSYPTYYISKNKIALSANVDLNHILSEIAIKFKNEDVITIDGVKINFEKEWVHLRKSNTEPIIRIYAESATKESADKLASEIMNEIKNLLPA